MPNKRKRKSDSVLHLAPGGSLFSADAAEVLTRCIASSARDSATHPEVATLAVAGFFREMVNQMAQGHCVQIPGVGMFYADTLTRFGVKRNVCRVFPLFMAAARMRQEIESRMGPSEDSVRGVLGDRREEREAIIKNYNANARNKKKGRASSTTDYLGRWVRKIWDVGNGRWRLYGAIPEGNAVDIHEARNTCRAWWKWTADGAQKFVPAGEERDAMLAAQKRDGERVYARRA